MLDWIQGGFDWALETAFRHRWLTLLVGVGSVVAAAFVAGALPQQVFPKIDRNQFAVEVYLSNGSTLDQTDRLVKRIERDLLGDNRVVDVTAFVGTSSPRFHTLYAPNMPSRHYAQLVVNTTSNQATVEVLRKFDKMYAGEVAEAWITWKQLEMSPTRSPIEIHLTGSDPESVRSVAARIKDGAKAIPGATWVRDDWEDALQSIEVVPDADMSARLGLSPGMLRTSMALGTQGLPVATIWEGDYPIRVLIEDEDKSRTSLEGLLGQQVSSMWLGASVPLEQVASLRPAWNEGAIIRRNGVQTLTVNVNVGMEALASDVQRQVERMVSSLGPTPGVTIEYEGEKGFAAETYTKMTKALVTSIACIYVILLVQFRRHGLALLVMATMPLSLFGAVFGLVVTGYGFGFTAFIGLISLMGMVVRNGIILVSYAEDLRKEGKDKRSAALAAGKRRMRPIYLTTMAAAVGVIPMILSRSTLWAPLAALICFGLLFSMVLTLFVLPVAYSMVVRDRPDGSSNSVVKAAVAVAAAMLGLVFMPAQARAADGPYTLAQSIELAKKSNSEMQQSRLEIEAAEEMKRAVYTKYFPQISSGAMALVAKDPLLQVHTPGGNLPVFDGNPANLMTATQFAYMPSGTMGTGNTMSVLTLSAIQPVYAGGRIRNANRLAQVGVDAAKISASMQERDATAQTEEKYWRVVVLKEKQRTLAAFEALLEALQRQVDDAVKAGLVTRNDQLKVQLQRSQAAIDRERLESGIQLASRDLRRHLGLPEGDAIELGDTLKAPEDPTPLKAQSQASEDRRPEIQLLEQAARAEELKVKLKQGEMLPTLSVGAAIFRIHPEGFPPMTNAVAFGALTVPITGIFEARHAVASQEKYAAAANRRLANTRKLIGLDVTKSWDELWATWKMASLSELAAEQAETNLKEASARYQNGLAPFSDVLEAELLRQGARDREIDVRSEYWLKRSAFLRAVGRGR
jgi:outer membrane protein TolC